MQYYVRKDQLDKMAKIAGMTSKDITKHTLENYHDILWEGVKPPMKEIYRLVHDGGPTKSRDAINLIERAVKAHRWKFTFSKREVLYKLPGWFRFRYCLKKEEPLERDVSRYKEYDWSFMRQAWRRIPMSKKHVEIPPEIRLPEETKSDWFDYLWAFHRAPVPLQKRMFREFYTPNELLLFLNPDGILHVEGRSDSAYALDKSAVASFKKALALFAEWGITDASIILTGFWGDGWNPEAQPHHLEELCKIFPVKDVVPFRGESSGGGQRGKAILQYLDEHVPQDGSRDVFVMAVDKDLDAYTVEDRTETFPFYYADAPEGFTDEDAKDMVEYLVHS